MKAGRSNVHEAEGDGMVSWQAHKRPYWSIEDNKTSKATILLEGHGQRHQGLCKELSVVPSDEVMKSDHKKKVGILYLF